MRIENQQAFLLMSTEEDLSLKESNLQLNGSLPFSLSRETLYKDEYATK